MIWFGLISSSLFFLAMYNVSTVLQFNLSQPKHYEKKKINKKTRKWVQTKKTIYNDKNCPHNSIQTGNNLFYLKPKEKWIPEGKKKKSNNKISHNHLWIVYITFLKNDCTLIKRKFQSIAGHFSFREKFLFWYTDHEIMSHGHLRTDTVSQCV